MKICKIMWSTNRPEFLIPTLDTSNEFIDWGDHEVDGIFIDDMPTDRDDEFITQLAEKSGYNHIVLHKENKGLPFVWSECIDILMSLEKEYDYIWHQEDDLIIKEHIKIDDLIDHLKDNQWLHQINIGYQLDWYEKNSRKTYKDISSYDWRNYKMVNSVDTTGGSFDTSFSLTTADKYLDAVNELKTGYLKWIYEERGESLSLTEGTMFTCMSYYSSLGPRQWFDKWQITLLNNKQEPITEHVGDWSWGKRITNEWLESFEKSVELLPEGKEKRDKLYQLKRYKIMQNTPSLKLDSRTWDPLTQ